MHLMARLFVWLLTFAANPIKSHETLVFFWFWKGETQPHHILMIIIHSIDILYLAAKLFFSLTFIPVKATFEWNLIKSATLFRQEPGVLGPGSGAGGPEAAVPRWK